MSTSIIAEYIHPDAPHDFFADEGERRCEQPLSECKTAQQLIRSGQEPQRGKVNRYRRKMGSETQGPQGQLLCNLCARAFVEGDPPKTTAKAHRVAANNPVNATVRGRNGRPLGFHLAGLRGVRLGMGLTQEKMGERLGVSARHISDMERDHTRASLKRAEAYATALGVTLDELKGSS